MNQDDEDEDQQQQQGGHINPPQEGDEEDNNNIDEELNNPATMQLYQSEIDRALEIKATVEADPGLRNLTDFEYVQYALVLPAEEATLAMVLEHAYAMQCFRDEYRIQDTPEEGIELFRQSAEQHPGFCLAVEYVSDSGNFISIEDVAAFYPSAIRGWREQRIGMGGLYYRYHCVSSTFQAIRAGVAIMVECDGCGVANFDSQVHERFMVEFFRYYPKRHKEVLFLNSPTIINIAHSLWKKYLTQNMKDAIRLGYQIEGMEGQRIDALFKTPSLEIAQEHMAQKVERFLKLRFRHQQTFRLQHATASLLPEDINVE